MAIDWDALYELAPSDTTYVKDTDDAIRSLKTATRERFTKEHEFDLASQARQGLHRAGSAVAFYQSSAPTQRNGVALGAADAGIQWIDSDNGMLSVWNGSAWVSPFSASGTANTLALRDSNGDVLGRALESTVATGTAPLRVASTTKADNLNADMIDGYHVGSVGNTIRAVHGFLHATSLSENSIFDALDPAIPNTNDWVPVTGSLSLHIVSRAVRISSTVIRFYSGFRNSDGTLGAVTTYDVTNGTATGNVQISIAW